MKTAALLQALNARIDELAASATPFASRRISQARFDQQLFTTSGIQFKDYLKEAQNNLRQLHHNVQQGKMPQVAFLAEKLVAQIAALQRELATQGLRKKEPGLVVAENLYQKLATHQDYERRLVTMISDRESQLTGELSFAQQQQAQHKLAVLEGRLLRCRQALTRIERAIERREQGLG